MNPIVNFCWERPQLELEELYCAIVCWHHGVVGVWGGQVEEIGDLGPGDEDRGLSKKQKAAICKVSIVKQTNERNVTLRKRTGRSLGERRLRRPVQDAQVRECWALTLCGNSQWELFLPAITFCFLFWSQPLLPT